MKSLLISTALVASIGTSVLAQTATTPVPFRTEMDPAMVHASEFIGTRVYAAEAEIDAEEYAGVQEGWSDIGEINDIILTRDGTVSAVLVDIGGFLGVGERQVAVDMTALRFVSDSATADNADDWFLVMNADRAMFENAPEWMSSMSDAPAGAPADATDTAAADTMATEPAATDSTATDGTQQTADAGADRAPMSREGYATVDAGEMTSETLTGATVYDAASDTSVGSVADLVIAADGSITDVIVDVGGFLGMGAKPVALPLDQVEILRNADGTDLRLYVTMSKDQLETLPEFQG